MRLLIAFILALTTVMSAELNKVDVKNARDSSPGIKVEYFTLYGSCRDGLPSFFDDEVNAAIICNKENDYRCFKACQFEKMGISDSSGNIGKDKFVEYMQRKLAKIKDATVVTKYLSAVTDCLSDKGNKFVLTRHHDQCARNEPFLNCTINTIYKNCAQAIYKKNSPPPVPTILE